MSRRIKFGVFAFLLLAVLVTCGVMIGGELLSRQKEKEDFEQLAKLVTVENLDISPTPTGPPTPDKPPETDATPAQDNEEEWQRER